MTFLIKLVVWVAIVMVLEFIVMLAFKVGDKVNRKRIKKLKEQNKHLIERMTRYKDDYHSIYGNMVRVNTINRELKLENEELKKQIDNQEHVTYNYYINK